MNRNIVIVNKSFDGYASGYAAWKKFRENAIYLVSGYNQPLPDIKIDENTNIYIMDFIYPKEVMIDLANRAASVIVLEHNKVSPEIQDDDSKFVVISDPDHSSCVTTWRYFHGDTKVPKPLLLVEDRNLWLFKLEDSENFHSGLLGVGLTDEYLKWDLISQANYFLNDVINKGKIVNEYKKSIIDDFIKSNRISTIDYGNGNKALLFNCINFISETSNKLLNENPEIDFTISYQIYKDGVRFDLRSRIGSDIDVSELVKKFGGGGNKNSAGFIVKDVMLSINDIVRVLFTLI